MLSLYNFIYDGILIDVYEYSFSAARAVAEVIFEELEQHKQ